MLTAFLWITLAASTVLIVAAASPIRLSCGAVYRENGAYAELRAAACYIHPIILRAEFSSADGRAKFFVFGFEWKEKLGGINKKGIDKNDTDTSADTDKNDINTPGGINTDNTGAAEAVNNADRPDNAGTANAGGDGTKDKKRSLFSRIKSKINAVKRGRAYKIIRDKPLRGKLIRWLKRSLTRAARIVSIENLKLRARVGTRDPAALGRLYGYFSAAKSALSPQTCRVDLAMEPVFSEKRFDIDAELRVKTTPSTIVWQIAMIAAAFPYRGLRRAMRVKSDSL